MRGRLAEQAALRHAGWVSTSPGRRRCSSLPALQLEQVLAAQLQSRLWPTYYRKAGKDKDPQLDTSGILHEMK